MGLDDLNSYLLVLTLKGTMKLCQLTFIHMKRAGFKWYRKLNVVKIVIWFVSSLFKLGVLYLCVFSEVDSRVQQSGHHQHQQHAYPHPVVSQGQPHLHDHKTSSSHSGHHTHNSNLFTSNYSMNSNQSVHSSRQLDSALHKEHHSQGSKSDLSAHAVKQSGQPFVTSLSSSAYTNAQSIQVFSSNGLPLYKPKPHNGAPVTSHRTVTSDPAEQKDYHQHQNHHHYHQNHHQHHTANQAPVSHSRTHGQVVNKQDSQESIGVVSSTSSDSYTKLSRPMSPPSHPPPPIPSSSEASTSKTAEHKAYNAKSYESSIHSISDSLHDQVVMTNSKLDIKYTQGSSTRDGSPCSLASGSQESFHISLDSSKSSRSSANSISRQNNKILQAVMHDKELDVSLENETRSLGPSEAHNSSYGGGGAVMSPTSELDYKTGQLQRHRQMHQSVGDLRAGGGGASVAQQSLRKPRSSSSQRPEKTDAQTSKAKSLDYLNKVNNGASSSSGKTKVVDIDIGESGSTHSVNVLRTHSHGELHTAGKDDPKTATSPVCSTRLRPFRQKTRNVIVSTLYCFPLYPLSTKLKGGIA